MLANTHTQTQSKNAHHYVSKKHVRMLENARKMSRKMPVYTPTKCKNVYKYVSKKHVRMLKNAHDIGIVS